MDKEGTSTEKKDERAKEKKVRDDDEVDTE